MPAADTLLESPPAGGAGQRRARPIYRVFVSSTWLDLQPERKALMEALNRMEEMRFVGMEFFGNRPDDTHDASIDQVDKCEVFIGIIGHRYGSGITEAEYRRARALGLPCFAYFKREDAARPGLTDNDPALAAKLVTFKQELLRGHTVKEFATPDELAANATADLHNWVASRWISLEREMAAAVSRTRPAAADADRTNVLRLIERIEQDWIKGVLEASLHHRAWLELGLDWREDAVEHPWDRIVVAPDRPIQTLGKEDSITGVFDAAQHTLLVLGEPGAGKTTTVLELARDLIARTRESAAAPVPVVLALSTWRGQQKDLTDWLAAELGLRYQVPKRVARSWLEEGRLVLVLDGLDEVVASRRADCVEAINAFEQAHHPPGLVVTCRVAEYDALPVKLRLRSAICLQPLTPAQIERYFKAAGASLDPLRLALRDDAGLRELARSPLMLSVMTMAWRDPGQTAAPFANAKSPEELRRQLFDAYVSAALNRRGKAAGGHTPEQTTRWLTWLACRMKENGHTVFALEQLQPGWLNGARRQLGYYLTSRLLGTVGLALPFLFLADSGEARALVAGLGLALGLYIGALDFAFARHGWGGGWRAALRFWTLLVASALLLLGWGSLGANRSDDFGYSLSYLLMASLAFCTALDVRALDIKPAGSMQWSWRLALDRALLALVFINLLIMLGLGSDFSAQVARHGWPRAMKEFGWPFLIGLGLAVVLVALAWVRLRPRRTLANLAKAVTLALIMGLAGGTLAFGPAGNATWAIAVVGNLMPMAAIGVFCGFASTMIDPARPQHAGAWFWLRVPLIAFLVVGLVMTVPGLMMIGMNWAQMHSPGKLGSAALVAVSVGAGCGLVAFFRFGGFNGAQHFFLRWQLARSGHLPAKAESFFNHATQLALMQKVGLGYRFVHALLLEHLAVTRGGSAARGAVDAAAGDVIPGAVRSQGIGRILSLAGLGAGTVLLLCVATFGLALRSNWQLEKSPEASALLFGSMCLGLWLAIPVLFLGVGWLRRRTWPWVAGGCLAAGLILAWLAVDGEAVRRPAVFAEYAPASPGAEQSHAVLMRYGYNHPAGKSFKRPAFDFNESPAYPKSWPDFLRQHRAAIEANWPALAPVREWVADLNAFDRLMDLPEDASDRETVAYAVRAAYIKNAMAISGLQALDGQGDAALATLQPMLEVGGKLEISSRRQGHRGLGRDMQNSAIRAAGFVLDTTTVSVPVRARFAAALDRGSRGPAGARRLYALRYAAVFEASASFGQAMAFAHDIPDSFLLRLLDLVGPFIFNQRSTLHRLGDLFAELEEFAAQRRKDKIDQRLAGFMAAERQARFKNMGGAWFNWVVGRKLSSAANERIGDGYWASEERRAALLARLTKP